MLLVAMKLERLFRPNICMNQGRIFFNDIVFRDMSVCRRLNNIQWNADKIFIRVISMTVVEFNNQSL